MTLKLNDLSALSAFLGVVNHGGFVPAAQALGMRQPTLSQKVQKLETGLGAVLFDRSQRPAALTEAGQNLAKEGPQLLARAERLAAQVAEFAVSDAAPILRMGMPDSLSEIMGAECVNSLSDLADQVELKSGISPWLETAFKQRDFTYAVDSPPFHLSPDIQQLPLFKDPFVIVRPRAMAGTTLTQLIGDESHVGYGRTSKFGETCSRIERQLGVERVPKFSFDSTQSLLRFVQTGYGWAVTSAICLFQSPAALKSIDVLPLEAPQSRKFSLLAQPGQPDDRSHKIAAKFKDIFTQLVDGPWTRTHADTAGMIRATNLELFLAPVAD